MEIDRTRKIFLVIVGIAIIVVFIWVFFKNYRIDPIATPTIVVFTPTNTPVPTKSTPALKSLTPTTTPFPNPTSIPSQTPNLDEPMIPTHTPMPPEPVREVKQIDILVDDFNPPSLPIDPANTTNHLDGDRGSVNNALVDWGNGQVTTTIASGEVWGGMWMSLNHPISEAQPINFAAVLPAQILPEYQSQIVRITAVIADGTPGKSFRLELKNKGDLQWKGETTLTGGPQTITFELKDLGNVNELLWILDNASENNFVVLDEISFTATTEITDPAVAAFVWSYGMLLNNWNPETGLVRDKGRDVSGIFDAIQATGSLAAATAMAEQLGIVSHEDAVQIVNNISDTLVNELPDINGVWPHWVNVSSTGEITIVAGTEWSTIDTAIAAIGLLEAQSGLGLDTTAVEQKLQSIDWDTLITDDGISHGYDTDGTLLPYAWDIFGGESWLIGLLYASAMGQVAEIPNGSPPTANGSGFIDEMAWLFVPPPYEDYWGTDWVSYRATAATNQISHYEVQNPDPCFSEHQLFGLSAAEIPYAPIAANGDIYQAFGVGGRFSGPNDGSALGTPVIIPHYSAMIASIQPQEAITMWEWLINHGYFTPLNNVESLAFPEGVTCDPNKAEWNQLKGSWNLSLQTLGWGRYLAERSGQEPILWQAITVNDFLKNGYRLLTEPQPTPWTIEREGEDVDEFTVGQTIERPDASANLVHGQFGTTEEFPWPEKEGYAQYNLDIPESGSVFLKLRYSKNSPSSGPILIFLDDEAEPRASLLLTDQGSWDKFIWTEPIPLGFIEKGTHEIKFSTEGQQYGVADIDQFILSTESP